jgi:hypothetical protein
MQAHVRNRQRRERFALPSQCASPKSTACSRSLSLAESLSSRRTGPSFFSMSSRRCRSRPGRSWPPRRSSGGRSQSSASRSDGGPALVAAESVRPSWPVKGGAAIACDVRRTLLGGRGGCRRIDGGEGGTGRELTTRRRPDPRRDVPPRDGVGACASALRPPERRPKVPRGGRWRGGRAAPALDPRKESIRRAAVGTAVGTARHRRGTRPRGTVLHWSTRIENRSNPARAASRWCRLGRPPTLQDGATRYCTRT